MFGIHLNRKQLLSRCGHALLLATLVSGTAYAGGGRTTGGAYTTTTYFGKNGRIQPTIATPGTTGGLRVQPRNLGQLPGNQNGIARTSSPEWLPKSGMVPIARRIHDAAWEVGIAMWGVSSINVQPDGIHFKMGVDNSRVAKGANCRLVRAGKGEPWQLTMDFYTWDSFNRNAFENPLTKSFELGKALTTKSLTAAFEKGMSAYLHP